MDEGTERDGTFGLGLLDNTNTSADDNGKRTSKGPQGKRLMSTADQTRMIMGPFGGPFPSETHDHYENHQQTAHSVDYVGHGGTAPPIYEEEIN